jgi:transcriptional regulator with XRE-family HTH domain
MFTICKKLRGLRIEKNLTTLAMSEKLGISEPTYRKYESATNSPDIFMLDKMANALDKNFLDLLPNACFNQKKKEQKGGVAVNIGAINNLSEKLIEQYEIRIKEQAVRISCLEKQLLK